jgi:hypothetical protein
MTSENPFTPIDPQLAPVLEELRPREPAFHTHGFGRTPQDYARSTSAEYWEVGASGRVYNHDLILDLAQKTPNHFVDAGQAGWRAEDFGLFQLGPQTYLLTYSLDQNGRPSRRASIWRREPDGWKILYHQGTIVTDEELKRLSNG